MSKTGFAVADAYVGSIVTGNTRALLVNQDRSTPNPTPVDDTPRVTLADPTRNDAATGTPVPCPAPPLLSHTTGAFNTPTRRPFTAATTDPTPAMPAANAFVDAFPAPTGVFAAVATPTACNPAPDIVNGNTT